MSQWSTGLWQCMDDPGNLVITCICPCITFGQIAKIVDKGSRSCVLSGTIYGLSCSFGLSCLYSCLYRSKMRSQYDLNEGPQSDCLVHFFYEQCSLCQEYRELKNRGFDMRIVKELQPHLNNLLLLVQPYSLKNTGWEANIERQKQGVESNPVMGAPAMPSSMIR